MKPIILLFYVTCMESNFNELFTYPLPEKVTAFESSLANKTWMMKVVTEHLGGVPAAKASEFTLDKHEWIPDSGK